MKYFTLLLLTVVQASFPLLLQAHPHGESEISGQMMSWLAISLIVLVVIVFRKRSARIDEREQNDYNETS
jgi:hypothetical protein